MMAWPASMADLTSATVANWVSTQFVKSTGDRALLRFWSVTCAYCAKPGK